MAARNHGHIVKNCPLNNKKGAGHSIVAQENKGEPDAKQESIKQDQNQLELDFQEISLVSLTNCKLTNGWYIDSAASKHMTFNKGLIFDFIEYNRPVNISLGDDTVISALGEGKAKLTCCNGSDKVVLVLNKVLYMPKLAKNLLSVPAMAQMGAEVVFNKDECIILKDSRKLTSGHIVHNKLYRVNTPEFANVSTVSKEPTMRQWHCRYGHLNRI